MKCEHILDNKNQNFRIQTPSDKIIQIQICVFFEHWYEQFVQVEAFAKHPKVVCASRIMQ